MDYDDSPKPTGIGPAARMPDLAGSSVAGPTAARTLPEAGIVGQRQVQAGQSLMAHTLRPVALQRQHLGPVLSLLGPPETAAENPAAQRSQVSLPPGAVEAALQRQSQDRMAVSAPVRPPQGPAEWVGAARFEIQRVQDPERPEATRWMGPAERDRHVNALRAAGQGLARGFRADRGPAVQRYAEYGQHLATLQREPLARSVVHSVLSQISPAERGALQRAVDDAVQRQAEQEEQDRATLALHQVQQDGQAEPGVNHRIEARRGSGQALPDGVRRPLEQALNHDLTGVRVHTDAEADLLARKVNAVAFTTGRDIYFRSGRFDPNSRSGVELLAHEAAHVRQQAQGQVGRGVDPDTGLETEARRFGQHYAAAPEGGRRPVTPAGAPGRTPARPPGGRGAVQRRAGPGEAERSRPASAREQSRGRAHAEMVVQVVAQGTPKPAPRTGRKRTLAVRPRRLPAAAPAKKAAGKGKLRLPVSKAALKAKAHPKAAVSVERALSSLRPGGNVARPKLKGVPVRAQAASFARPQLDVARLKAAGVNPVKAMRAAEQRRKQSGALVSAFMRRNSGKSKSVQAMAQTLSGQVHQAAAVAKRRVQATAVKHSSVLRASVVAARAQASAQARVATAQLNARAQATLRALPKTTQVAKTKLKTAHTKEEAHIRTQAAAQKTAVRAAFQSGAAQYRAAGGTVGGEAMAHAEGRASDYLSHVTGKNDSFLDGPLTDNRWKARADAARQVGSSYQKGYVDEGNTQATTLLGGMDKDLEAIEETAESARTGLQAQLQSAEQRLETQEAAARTQVQQAQAGLARAIQSQLQAVLAQLSSSQGAGLAAITQAAAAQSHSLDTQASGASRSLQRSVTQIAQQLDRTLNSFGATVRGSQAPDPAALKKALAGAEGQIDRMVSGARAQLGQGLTRVTGSLASGAAAAEASIGAAARSGETQARQTASGFTRSSQTLIGQALKTLTQLQQGYEKSSQAGVQQTQEAFDAAGRQLDKLYEQAKSGLSGKMSASVEALVGQLRKNFSQLDAAINAQAEKAAAQVQPRWKGWAKIALMVAVVIVVAVVAGPMVIGAVGAVAGALGAGAAAGAIGMVVGGAVVGAAAGAATQIGNNAIDNVGVDAANRKSLFDGVGKAAAIGAIGGVVGGAGGAIAQGLGTAGRLGTGALTQKVAGFGVTTAFDLGGNVAGDLATGTNLSDALKNLTNPQTLMMMAIGTGVGAATTRLPGTVGKVQTGAHGLGEHFGNRVGEGIANTTGHRGAPVPTRVNPELPGNSARVTGYAEGRTRVEVSSGASPEMVAVHQSRGVDLRSENSLFQKVNNGVREQFGLEPSGRPAGTERSRLEHEAIKHQDLADTYTRQAQESPEGSLKRQQLQDEAARAREYAEDYRQRASKTNPAEPDSVGSVETRLERGRVAAKRLGLPDAPTGQRWELQEGATVPVLKSTDATGPKMRYDPSDPLEPFKEIGEGMIPAERGPATIHPWQDELIVSRQNESDVKMSEQLARVLDERARLVSERNELEDRLTVSTATDAELIQLKQIRNQINDQSRIIGEHAGTSFVKGQYPEAELIYGGPESTSRSGDFDQVWRVKGEDGSPMYVVVEAKGGTSPLGDRIVDGSRAQQGSTEYFDSILENMANSRNANMKRAGNALLEGRLDGNVKYFEVRAPITSSVSSVGSAPVVKNALTYIVVKEFKIRPS